MMPKFELESFRPGASEFVQIIDDGRVAYAYFFAGNKITGSVWLYNRVPAVKTLSENQRPNPPVNATTFIAEEKFIQPGSIDEFSFTWNLREGVWEVNIYINSKLHAVVGDGDIPGWCILAIRDGPLAMSLR